MLHEEYQILPNGVKRARDVPVAEKMKAGEAWQAAVMRAVKEELGSVLPPDHQVHKLYIAVTDMQLILILAHTATHSREPYCFNDCHEHPLCLLGMEVHALAATCK